MDQGRKKSVMKICEKKLNFGSLSSRTETKNIIIHHTAATHDFSAEDIHEQHKKLGWSGIGYHFLIRKDGTIERGRPEESIGAHAEGANSYSIGIALNGDFEEEKPEPQQIHAAKELVFFLLKKYKLTADSVKGHCSFNATACPGKNLLSKIKEITEQSSETPIEGKIYAHGGKVCIAIAGEEYEINAPSIPFSLKKRTA